MSHKKKLFRHKNNRRLRGLKSTRKPDRRIDDILIPWAAENCSYEPVYMWGNSMWRQFTDTLSEENLDYVLSFDQHKNWNVLFYEECKKRKAGEKTKVIIKYVKK